MLVKSRLILLAEQGVQIFEIVLHGIEHALFATQPGLLFGSKYTLEQVVGQHLRRQRTVIAGPAQISMDALPVRLLADADLQRVEASLTADLRGDGLVDRRTGAASPAIGRARDQTAHRFVMAVAGTRNASRGI